MCAFSVHNRNKISNNKIEKLLLDEQNPCIFIRSTHKRIIFKFYDEKKSRSLNIFSRERPTFPLPVQFLPKSLKTISQKNATISFFMQKYSLVFKRNERNEKNTHQYYRLHSRDCYQCQLHHLYSHRKRHPCV